MTKGSHHTRETKTKMREKAKLHIGRLNSFYGKYHSEETRRRISEAKRGMVGTNLGKHFSEEHRRSISESHLGPKHPMFGKHQSEESNEKRRLAMRGKVFSLEHNQKISKALTGKPVSLELRQRISEKLLGHVYPIERNRAIAEAELGEKNHNWGKHLSVETRQKLRMSQLGEKGSNWQGGKSYEPYSAQFNREIRSFIRWRDGYVCQGCGIPETECFQKLQCHHIDYDKKNSEPSNLIALCSRCNTKANYNRGYWESYFRELLERRGYGQ